MMRRAALVPALAALLACGESTGIDGSCVAVVNVDGTLYGPASLPAVPQAEVGPVYLRVTANTGCLDQGQPPVELEPGMSNFLDPGTELRRVEGFEPEERLTRWAPVVAEWLVLAPHPAF
jgi:hypothetical protein